jgi:hypothetical protein
MAQLLRKASASKTSCQARYNTYALPVNDFTTAAEMLRQAQHDVLVNFSF